MTMNSTTLRQKLFRAASRALRTGGARRIRLGVRRLEDRTVPATFTVLNALDGPVSMPNDVPGSLRHAIFDAKAAPGADTIQFDPAVFAPPLPSAPPAILLSGELLIDDTNGLTITNQGLIVGGDEVRVDVNGGFSSNRVLHFDNTGAATNIAGLALTFGLVIGNGGGVLIENSNVSMTNCLIANNVAIGGAGGGIYLAGGSLTLVEGVVGTNQLFPFLAGNTADDSGGGIHVESGTLTLSGAAVSSNTAGGNGGGLFFHSGTLTIANKASLSGNSAIAHGGGIFSRVPVTLNAGSTVNLNRSNGNGGGIFADQVQVNLLADSEAISSVIENAALGDGGGIYIDADASPAGLTIQSGQISSNIAGGHGGGVFSEFGSISMFKAIGRLTKPLVSVNEAQSGDGGGIYQAISTGITLTEAVIYDNIAASDGGGIFAEAGSPVLTESLILKNTATNGDGGGIACGGLTVQSSTEIGENKAKQNGGGVRAGGAVTITNSKLISNFAGNGGGIYMSSGTLTTKFSEFSNSADVDGGSMYLAGANLEMSYLCKVLGHANNGDGGGAVFDGGVLNIYNSEFDRGCTATKGSGGGIRLRDGALMMESTIMQKSMTGVTKNATALFDGGAICATRGKLTLKYCTIIGTLIGSDTVVSRGGAIYTSVPTQITSCLIDGHSGDPNVYLGNSNGGAVFVDTPANQPGVTDKSTKISMSTINGQVSTQSSATALGGYGGGVCVETQAEVFVDLTTISGIAPKQGGGIFNKGQLTVTASTFEGSSAGTGGGGIFSSGALTLKGCTISENKAADPLMPNEVAVIGGGMYLTSAAEIKNCTISGNIASHGGGIVMKGVVSTLLNCTVTNNLATGVPEESPPLPGNGGGVFLSGFSSSVTLELLDATIVAQNSGEPVTVGGITVKGAPDIFGTDETAIPVVIRAQYSLVGVADLGFKKAKSWPGDRNLDGGIDDPRNARLAGLEFNGGPTKTHRLEFVSDTNKSPAIDAGRNAAGEPSDQRRLPLSRTYSLPGTPDGPKTDIGAYELQPPKVLSVITWAESESGIVDIYLVQPSKSRVNFITITFDQTVQFSGNNAANAVSFVKYTDYNMPTQSSTPVGFDAIVTNNGQMPVNKGDLVTLVFNTYIESGEVVPHRSLVDGRYGLKIDASKVNVEGFGGTSAYNLIGSATTPNIGSDYDSVESDNRRIWRLFGDLTDGSGNPDAAVSNNDFNLFRTAFLSNASDGVVIFFNFICGFDFDGSGDIGNNDFNALRERFGSTV